MDEATKRQMAAAAAQWWANLIRDIPQQSKQAGYDGELASGLDLLQAIAGDTSATPDQANRFEALLLLEILNNWDNVFRQGLHVDYQPCDALAVAAIAAGCRGVDMMLFPYKTHLYFYEDHIAAHSGYGQPNETIWTAARREPGATDGEA